MSNEKPYITFYGHKDFLSNMYVMKTPVLLKPQEIKNVVLSVAGFASSTVATNERVEKIFNHLHDRKVLSFPTSEGLFQYFKALHHLDIETAEKIISAGHNGYECKKLGKEVKGFDRKAWRKIAPHFMYHAIRMKFQFCTEMGIELLKTGNAYLIEASPIDFFWGIGLSKEKVDEVGLSYILDSANTKLGKNMTGNITMHVRKELNVITDHETHSRAPSYEMVDSDYASDVPFFVPGDGFSIKLNQPRKFDQTAYCIRNPEAIKGIKDKLGTDEDTINFINWILSYYRGCYDIVDMAADAIYSITQHNEDDAIDCTGMYRCVIKLIDEIRRARFENSNDQIIQRVVQLGPDFIIMQ